MTLRRVLLATLAIAGICPAAARSPISTQPQDELHAWIQARAGGDRLSRAGRYSIAIADLNGDTSPEGLVYVTGAGWCGSGGCPLYILRRNARRWQLVNSVTLVNLPVRMLMTKSGGWHDLAVRVRGGGIMPGYEAVLRFDGRRYPGNPSVPPAQRARKEALGRTLISGTPPSRPIFP